MSDRPNVTSGALRTYLAHLRHNVVHLQSVLPEAHRLYRMPRGDADGLRSVAPSGSSRASDVSDPTARTAMANLAADERSPNITPAAPPHVIIDHVLRIVLRLDDLAGEATRALMCIEAELAAPPIARCDTCAMVLTEAPRRSGDGKPQCGACNRREARHARPITVNEARQMEAS